MQVRKNEHKRGKIVLRIRLSGAHHLREPVRQNRQNFPSKPSQEPLHSLSNFSTADPDSDDEFFKFFTETTEDSDKSESNKKQKRRTRARRHQSHPGFSFGRPDWNANWNEPENEEPFFFSFDTFFAEQMSEMNRLYGEFFSERPTFEARFPDFEDDSANRRSKRGNGTRRRATLDDMWNWSVPMFRQSKENPLDTPDSSELSDGKKFILYIKIYIKIYIKFYVLKSEKVYFE